MTRCHGGPRQPFWQLWRVCQLHLAAGQPLWSGRSAGRPWLFRTQPESTWLPRSSALTSGRPTRSCPSWKAAIPSSSPTPRAGGPPPRSSRSPRTVSASSARWPSARPSPTPSRPSSRSSGSWAAAQNEIVEEMKRVPYKVVQGPNGLAAVEDRRQDVHPARDLGDDPAEDEADRRGLPRPHGGQGGHHRPRLLQRRPAAGHQGRRQDRRPRRAAHHQRAHGRGAGVRPRQEEGREGRRLRPRRRHLRHLRARARRGRLRGEEHQRRHPPGRRRLRPAPDRLAGHRVQEGPGHRPLQGRRWRSSA